MFNVLMLKLIFKKIKKNYFNAFLNKKYFKKQLISHSQIPFNPNNFIVLFLLLCLIPWNIIFFLKKNSN